MSYGRAYGWKCFLEYENACNFIRQLMEEGNKSFELDEEDGSYDVFHMIQDRGEEGSPEYYMKKDEEKHGSK